MKQLCGRILYILCFYGEHQWVNKIASFDNVVFYWCFIKNPWHLCAMEFHIAKAETL